MHYNCCGILIRKVSLTSSTYSSQYTAKKREKSAKLLWKIFKKIWHFEVVFSSENHRLFMNAQFDNYALKSVWKFQNCTYYWILRALCVLTASKTEWWCDLMVLFVLDQNCWMKSNNWRRKEKKDWQLKNRSSQTQFVDM